MSKDIYVTHPHLPPLEEFQGLLSKIWESGHLTNSGPYHQELEQALCDYLKVPYISLFNNGTIALVTALRALGIKGEVITTPFSFVATSHAILWTECTPVFVDVDAESLNLDPAQIRSAITKDTAAILPVHCYGHPADVDAIDAIGAKHDIPVIYDAAHAFGVECHCGSVLTHGDLSVLSFHATKVFNTFEGGAVVCKTPEMKRYVDQLKNFGHEGETVVIETGINGKMSEINAAMGLIQLNHIDGAIAQRAEIDRQYRERLADLPGIHCVKDSGQMRANYAYFPIRVGPDFPISRDALYTYMKERGVHPRRYFYPLIPEFPMYSALPTADRTLLPNAARAADEILCLPIYPGLDDASLSRIIALLHDAAASGA
ncbi:DegT/DnrJ/EryC1/StrS aminotransferase family protein [Tateyamaria sp. syn59]|uniref:DegT/DnrJ/EryC1/StrS family aminotransferase n=1 Tax=Tateyamaria sp. syn59 TaxID=2576942 RepID=UPI0011BE1433|nr:DegT/DnrJ/EryC1/StrS family aminotransferase [Tateyamaria sp. syn59]